MRQIRLAALALLAAGATACTTTASHPVPSDVTQAEQVLADARAGVAAKALPHSLDRAERALGESHALLDKAAKAPEGSGDAKRLEAAAMKKANEAGEIAMAAHELGLKIASWDARIEEFADEQASDKLLELMAAEVTAACVEGQGPDDGDDGPAGAEGGRGDQIQNSGGGMLGNGEFVSPVAFFAPHGADLREQDLTHIASLAELLLSDPTLKVRLVGHADERGNESRGSDSLPVRRARAVGQALVEAGIKPARIEIGHADEDDEGLAGGASEAERQLDRRVEAHVVGDSPMDAEGFVP